MNASSEKPMPAPKELSLSLSPELHESLSALAAQTGKAPDSVAKEMLRESLMRQAEMERRRKALLELVAETEELGLYD